MSNLKIEITPSSDIILRSIPINSDDSSAGSTEVDINISYDDFLSMFGGSISTPTLPYGTIKYVQDHSSYSLLIMYSPEGTYSPTYDEKQFNIVKPNELWVFLLSKSDLGLRLAKTIIIPFDELETPYSALNRKHLAVSLFPNYSPGYSTGVCWGNSNSEDYTFANTTDFEGKLHLLESFPRRYYNSVFNTDLLYPSTFNMSRLMNDEQFEFFRLKHMSFLNRYYRKEDEINESLRKSIQLNSFGFYMFLAFLEYCNEKGIGYPYGAITPRRKHVNSILQSINNPIGMLTELE